MQDLFGVIASVLHLGNVKFDADARGYATLSNNPEMHWVSKVESKPVFKSYPNTALKCLPLVN